MTGPRPGDALGRALIAHLEGQDGFYIVERDDGLVEPQGAAIYFTEPPDWHPVEATVLDRTHGTVLDIGAGAGRHALALQERGHDVLALDVSPGALEVCRRRGVKEVFTGTVFDLAASPTPRFDTLLLMGHNLGLLESDAHAVEFLDACRAVAAAGAQILGTSRILATDDPLHLRYHETNRARGRLPGQLRIRVRYEDLASDWFDYLIADPDDVAAMAARAGWRTAAVDTAGEHFLVRLGGA